MKICKGQICKSSSSLYIVLYAPLEEKKMQNVNKEARRLDYSFTYLFIYL